MTHQTTLQRGVASTIARLGLASNLKLGLQRTDIEFNLSRRIFKSNVSCARKVYSRILHHISRAEDGAETCCREVIDALVDRPVLIPLKALAIIVLLVCGVWDLIRTRRSATNCIPMPTGMATLTDCNRNGLFLDRLREKH